MVASVESSHCFVWFDCLSMLEARGGYTIPRWQCYKGYDPLMSVLIFGLIDYPSLLIDTKISMLEARCGYMYQDGSVVQIPPGLTRGNRMRPGEAWREAWRAKGLPEPETIVQ